MGQIKNIKLHIVTDIKQVRRRGEDCLAEADTIMKYFVVIGALVVMCVVELVSGQGPRSCDRCQELEEEIGQKLKGRTPLISIEQLKKLCPTMAKANSTEYCDFVASLWEKNLEKEEKRKVNTLVESVLNSFNWFYIPRSITGYHSLCQLVDICFF